MRTSEKGGGRDLLNAWEISRDLCMRRELFECRDELCRKGHSGEFVA
jgi:hypothetical protein